MMLKNRFPHVRCLFLPENRGFAANVNAGLATIDDDVLLVNDDTVTITSQWMDFLGEHDDAGAVGATSNCALIHQLVTYPNRPLLDDVPTLSFFWILLKKHVLDDVGYLDEDFGIGTSEDLDWCLRAKKKGHKLLVDRRIYVHHYGGQTLQRIADIAELERKNKALLWEKHPEFSSVACTEAAPPGSPTLSS